MKICNYLITFYYFCAFGFVQYELQNELNTSLLKINIHKGIFHSDAIQVL